MNFRPYTTTDYATCLDIFDSNVPLFFAPKERVEFIEFLENPQGSYFVLADDEGVVVACGGYDEMGGSAYSHGEWCGAICTNRA